MLDRLRLAAAGAAVLFAVGAAAPAFAVTGPAPRSSAGRSWPGAV